VHDLLPVADVRVAEAGRRRVGRVGGEVEELVDDRRELQRGESVDLGEGRAESGSPKEVRYVGGCSGQSFLLGLIWVIRVSTESRTELEQGRASARVVSPKG
jgi:hypothetical protein